MTRVGLVVHGGGSWLGGVYYVRTMSRVLASLSGRYHPVWLVPREKADFAREVERTEGVETATFVADHGALPIPVARALGVAGHRTIPLERAALKANLDCVLPLTMGMGRRSRVPWLGWMFDFQHLHHPEFFSPVEIASRSRAMRRLAAEASHVIVSSHHALGIALELFPWLRNDVTALRFPCLREERWFERDPNDTVRRYAVDEGFIYLPGQFWVHKNHATVLRAWAVLGREAPMLVCSGDTTDYRRPGHLAELRSILASTGLDDRVRILGRVPREDQIDLYRASRAVLNPSLYEGWSTTVEEARVLGKPLILSDIPLFREQAPHGARFFPALDPASLAETVREASRSLRPGPDPDAERRAESDAEPIVTAYRSDLDHAIRRALVPRVARMRLVL